MIKLHLNKYKLISVIKITEMIKQILPSEFAVVTLSLKRAEITAHNFVINELSRKLRSKYISIEHKPGTHNFFISIDEMQAYILMLYYHPDLSESITPYDLSVMGEILTPCFKHLLN